jgi:hypothetical protein
MTAFQHLTALPHFRKLLPHHDLRRVRGRYSTTLSELYTPCESGRKTHIPRESRVFSFA